MFYFYMIKTANIANFIVKVYLFRIVNLSGDIECMEKDSSIYLFSLYEALYRKRSYCVISIISASVLTLSNCELG